MYKTTDDGSVDSVVRYYDVHIPLEAVAAYFYVPPPLSPVSEIPPARLPSPLTTLLREANQPEPITVTVTSKPQPKTDRMPPTAPAPLRRDQRDIAETLNRLTQPTRPRTVVGNAANTVKRFIFRAYFQPLPHVRPGLRASLRKYRPSNIIVIYIFT